MVTDNIAPTLSERKAQPLPKNIFWLPPARKVALLYSVQDELTRRERMGSGCDNEGKLNALSPKSTDYLLDLEISLVKDLKSSRVRDSDPIYLTLAELDAFVDDYGDEPRQPIATESAPDDAAPAAPVVDEAAPIVTADKIDADPADEIEAAPTDPDDYEANERRRLDQRYRRGPYSDRNGAPTCLGRYRNSALAACQTCPMAKRCEEIMREFDRPDRATRKPNAVLDALCEKGARQAERALVNHAERRRARDAARKRQTRASTSAASTSAASTSRTKPPLSGAERERRRWAKLMADPARVEAERERQRLKKERQRAAKKGHARPVP